MEASTLDIIVPEGSAGGSTVSFTDALGTPRQAVVPAGLMPGDVFSVRIDLGDIPMAQLNAGFERSASVSASSAMQQDARGGSPTWLGEILDGLTADGFAMVMDAFLNKECAKFLLPGTQGHTLEQTQVHERYVRLYESRIEAYLKRHGVSGDEFLAALVAAEGRSGGAASLASSLLLVNDFPAFATMMLQRALEQ